MERHRSVWLIDAHGALCVPFVGSVSKAEPQTACLRHVEQAEVHAFVVVRHRFGFVRIRIAGIDEVRTATRRLGHETVCHDIFALPDAARALACPPWPTPSTASLGKMRARAASRWVRRATSRWRPMTR